MLTILKSKFEQNKLLPTRERVDAVTESTTNSLVVTQTKSGAIRFAGHATKHDFCETQGVAVPIGTAQVNLLEAMGKAKLDKSVSHAKGAKVYKFVA